MVFELEISRNSTDYFYVDLFPEQELEYNVDFYDSLELNQIKLPFSSTMKIPLTNINKSSSRFNYDPLTSDQSLFPKDDFFFKITIFRSTDIIIEGILNVTSIEYLSDEPYIDVQLKDFVSKYISELKDATVAEVYDADTTTWRTTSYNPTTNLTMDDFFNLVAAGGERGIIGQNPADRPIIFPYIDFCNDVKGKFGYGARQFTEYGSGMDRAGIVPSFSVKNFLTTIGYWLTAQGFDTRVDSKLFGLNYTEYDSAFEAEKLQMLLPCKLEADQGTNTRNFHLNQAPFWAGTNESLTGNNKIDGTAKDVVTNYFWNSETFGNFGTHTTDPEDPNQTIPSTAQTDYGLDVTNAAYPENEAFGYERGYFAPFMSFNADIDWNSGSSSADPRLIDYELPILGEDKMTYDILTSDPGSDMTFGIFIGVWENGEMIKKIRMQDSNGDDIILTCEQATTVRGNSKKTWLGGSETYHFFTDDSYDRAAVFASNLTSIRDMMRWNLPNLGLQLYIPADEELEVSGESRYGTNYFIEPLQGNLVARVVNASFFNDQGSGSSKRREFNTLQQLTFSTFDVRKAITRTNDYGRMDIKITANANFNPYFGDDEYNLKDSLENTCTVTPYDVLNAICKRFGCGIFYEYDSVNNKNVFRVDPLHLVRSGSQNINNLVDDLKSVKVLLGGDKIKNLIINNNDYGLYYDDENNDDITIGSTTQEINPDGISDLTVDLKSAIYYNSVCGDALEQFDNDNLKNNIVSSKEVGFTPNLFTKHQDIGIRFAYVDKPLYRTNVKRPVVVNSSHRPNIYTITQRIYENWELHVFNGRLRHINLENFNLLAEDESGNTTDYYDLFSANEKIKFSNRPSIEFDMVVPTENLSSLDFFFQTLSCTRINASDILVKSAEGEVFEDYAYLTIKGLLQ
jgi:hypothetical protein